MEPTKARAVRLLRSAARPFARPRRYRLAYAAMVPVALLAFLADPALLIAQEEAGESSRRQRVLSLDDAVARAVERGPAIAISVQDLTIARASRVGASLRIPVRPHVQAEFRPNVDPQLAGAAPGYGAMAEIPLDLTRAPMARIAEADRRAQVAVADLALVELEIRLATIAAYVEARLGDERVTSAEDALAIAARVLSATRERAGAGASSEIDVSTAAHAAALSEAELADARAARLTSYATLAALLDLDPAEIPALTTPIDDPPAPPSTATIEDAVFRAHPAVAAIDARQALHAATLARLERELAPVVGVYAGVDHAPASPVFGIVGLAVELPVGPRNQGARAIAAAERDAQEMRAELVDRQLAREAMMLARAYAERRDALQRLATDAVPLAERRLALVEEGFRYGRLDVFRVAMARDDLVRTRAMRIAALGAAWQTWLALERALGETP